MIVQDVVTCGTCVVMLVILRRLVVRQAKKHSHNVQFAELLATINLSRGAPGPGSDFNPFKPSLQSVPESPKRKIE
eukprot:3322202-Amphidinium_carterae.1